MANIQINIAANGTTTLDTKGRVCREYIDINVDVPAKATQFTNRYDPSNVVLQTRSDCSSSTGVQFNADTQVNYLVIPYHHEAGEPFVLRMRGIGTVRDRMNISFFKEDGTTIESWGQIPGSVTVSYDEYGDVVLTFQDTNIGVTKEWHYVHLNFQYVGVNSKASVALTGPIVTINEPIGNGGYAG